MCGIVGVVLKTDKGFLKQTEDTFYQMLYADALRGDDSTGIISVENDTTFHISKEASHPAWFIPTYDSGKVGKAMWSDGKAMIGHNRKKTIGNIDDESAHPFVVNGEFAMVHNGTLFNHQALAKTAVDSEALTIHLHKAFEKNNTADVENALGEVYGAYAVAMYDQRHNVVRLLRNKDRPLCYMEVENAWYFASEGGMLYWILSRNGYNLKDTKMEFIPEHTLITFDLATNTIDREVLVPKKHYTPPTKTITKAPTGGATTNIGKDGLSKNAFKRFRRKTINTKLEWWCEDFIETNYPKTIEDGEVNLTLMGVCDDMLIDHMLSTEINYLDLCLGPNDLTDRLWTGIVEDMFYDVKSKRVTIRLKDALPLPVSYRKSSTIIDGEYIRRKLDEKEKAEHTVH
jgi:hypothetical protein